MAAIRGRNTKPELTVRRLLHRLGFRYLLHGRGLPGKPDLVFPSRRKVVFIHGCYWHSHACRLGAVVPATRTDFWQAKRGGTVQRDARNLSALNAAGWQSLVVWECELRDREKLTAQLVGFLGAPRSR